MAFLLGLILGHLRLAALAVIAIAVAVVVFFHPFGWFSPSQPAQVSAPPTPAPAAAAAQPATPAQPAVPSAPAAAPAAATTTTNTSAIVAEFIQALKGMGYVISQPSTGTGAAQAATCPDKDHEMKPNEVYETHMGCTAKGDVEFSNSAAGPWTRLYDDRAETGLLVTCAQQKCFVHTTQWGANVSPRTPDDLLLEMFKSGCEGSRGCQTVDRKNWPTTLMPILIAGSTGLVDCGFSMKTGDIMLVPAGCTITGDISVGTSQTGPWTFLGTGRQDVGLAVQLSKETWVSSPFGASVTSASLDNAAQPMYQVGCGLVTGCRDVKKVRWPN